MSQQFYKGRTNNHLTWVMVDSTDFATPESALSAATKIKIYGKVRGATGTYFVSSGTGSLTNDITHVGASALGIYTIALAKADLSDASNAWYDQYIISLSATGAAYQTLIVDGGIDASGISSIESQVSDLQSYVTSLSGLVSDAHSAAAAGASRALLNQSLISDVQSFLSDFQSDLLSHIDTTGVQINASTMSDLRSAITAITATISASDISDIASATYAMFASDVSDLLSRTTQINSRVLLNESMVSDVYSLLSDLNSNFGSRIPKEPAARSQLSDLASDIKSAVGNVSVTLTASDISDIASAVVANLPGLNASDISDIASAVWAAKYTAHSGASSFGSLFSDVYSRIVQIQSTASDAASAAQQGASRALVNQSRISDVQSQITAGVALDASTMSDLRSAIAATELDASDLSDIASAVYVGLVSDLSDILSAAQQTNSLVLLNQSRVSDIYSLLSDVSSDLGVMSGVLSDTYSLVTAVAADLPQKITKNTALSNFEFLMVDSTDHVTGKTGLTITATRSIDGAAFAACANSATEVANGIYKINLAAADLNGDCITLKFTASGADARFITILTQPT